MNQPVIDLAVDDLSAAASRKFRMPGDIGGAADLVLMSCDEHAVAGHDQIGLDVIRTLLDGQPIGLQGVFGPLAAGAAMGNDNRCWYKRTPVRI